jgi:hypothetical protein
MWASLLPPCGLGAPSPSPTNGCCIRRPPVLVSTLQQLHFSLLMHATATITVPLAPLRSPPPTVPLAPLRSPPPTNAGFLPSPPTSRSSSGSLSQQAPLGPAPPAHGQVLRPQERPTPPPQAQFSPVPTPEQLVNQAYIKDPAMMPTSSSSRTIEYRGHGWMVSSTGVAPLFPRPPVNVSKFLFDVLATF